MKLNLFCACNFGLIARLLAIFMACLVDAAVVASLQQGSVQQFDSASSSKAQGLRFTIDYPTSWSARDSSEPNTVQIFLSNRGSGPEMASIQVIPTPALSRTASTSELITEILDSPEFSKLVAGTAPGTRILSQELSRWAGRPAARVVHQRAINVNGSIRTVRGMILMTVFDGRQMVMFHGMTSTASRNSGVVDRAFRNSEPTLEAMAASFTIENRSVIAQPQETSGMMETVLTLAIVGTAVAGGLTALFVILRRSNRPLQGSRPAPPVVKSKVVSESPAADGVKSPDVSRRNGGPTGIAGWLILPAIGAVVNPFLFFSSYGVIRETAASQSASLSSDYLLVLNTNAYVYLAMAGICSFYSLLFFTKNRHVPRLFICIAVANILLPIVFTAWSDSFFSGESPARDAMWKSLGGSVTQSVILAAIWVPYFLRSKRVKNTFTTSLFRVSAGP